MPIDRYFKLYLNAGRSIPLVINANQYDSSETWYFTLYTDRGEVYLPSSGAIIGIKADGHIIDNAATVDSRGRVVVTETEQMTAAAGKAVFEISIDDNSHGSANFIVLVKPKPSDGGVLSDSDLSLIQEAIDSTSPAAIAEGVSDWMDEHLTPTTPVVDDTLTVQGAAADAKKTGDEIADLKSALDYGVQTLVDSLANGTFGSNYTLYAGGINSTGNSTSNGARCRTGFISLNGGIGYKLHLNSADYKIISIHLYQNSGDTVSLRQISEITNTTAFLTRNASENYVRVSFAHVDDTQSISASDIATIKPLFSISIITDTSLSVYDMPADSKVVGDRFANVYDNLNHNVLTDFTWELGSIGTTGGTNSTSVTRVRTAGYYEINNGGYVISTNAGYKYTTRFYDSDKNYIAEYRTDFDDVTRTISLKDRPLAKYIRLVVARNDDSTISEDDVNTVASNLNVILSDADVTLTRLGFSADAYTVGKLFHKPIKVLGIGNSYTRDSLRWLWKILKECGYGDVVVGHGYIGAITLAEQYNSIIDSSDTNHSAYQYWKYTDSQTATKTNNQTLESIIKDETWDVVIFQQQSDETGQYNSFVSENFDINSFVSYVKSNIGNANLRIGLALTWSHATGYTGEKFIEYYGGDPTVQLNAIKDVIPQVADHMTQCDFIVNSGLAVEYGRNNTYLNALGVEMLRTDKNHLYYGIPSFMVGMVYAMTICGVKPSDLSWYPTATDEGQAGITTSAYLSYLAKQCALKATTQI